MIKINPKSIEQKAVDGSIHTVYTEKRYLKMVKSADGTTKQSKLSLAEVVAKRINAELNNGKHDPAHEISKQFLRKHFPANVTDTDVEAYLVQNDLTDIISSFWECVTKVWIYELQKEARTNSKIKLSFPYVDPFNPKNQAEIQLITDIAECLSRWNSIRARVLETNGVKDRNKVVKKRINIVREVINDQTLPFFDVIEKKDLDPNNTSNTAISNLSTFRTVKFHYHSHLYSKKGQNASSNTSKPPTQDTALEILESIFDYDLLNGDPRHKLLSAFEVPVCPYCNRQYITLYRENKNEDRTTADLDHFYIKSIHPYLALSLYNFVPSCQICNSRFKGDTDFYATPHLYPYTQKSNSLIKFSIHDPLILAHFQQQDQVSTLRKDMSSADAQRIISVCPTNSSDEQARNSIKTFHLEEVYQSHKDYVYDLLLKIHAYDDTKIQALYQEFPDLFKSEDEVRSLVFGQCPDSEDMLKQPLSKLTQDLLALRTKGKE